MSQPGQYTSLDDWLRWLETLSPREIVLGLARVRQVLERLHLGRPRRVIHVAGTNGKGSSVAILEAILLQSGHSAGCYTSPHLRRYNERIRVRGQDVGDAELVAAFLRVEEARQQVPLTYFEFGTLAAMVIFDRQDLQTVILEVGMGGRLDAVNAIEPDAAIITNISLDHCDWLGDDIESIAAEKAGIMRPGQPVIYGDSQVPAAITNRAANIDADLRVMGRDFGFQTVAGAATWSWHGRDTRYGDLPMPRHAPAIQVQNAAGVLALLETLDVLAELPRHAVDEAMADLQVPGRSQIVQAGRTWLLDVAHNADSARVLARWLPGVTAGRKIVAIIGAMANKDHAALVEPLTPFIAQWIAVTAAASRAAEAAALGARIASVCDKPCLVCERLEDALEIADRRAAADDPVLITGSFYVVGPALDELYSRRREGANSCNN